jgi:hypothetical protein
MFSCGNDWGIVRGLDRGGFDGFSPAATQVPASDN